LEDFGGADALNGEVNHVWSFDLCLDLLLVTIGVFPDGKVELSVVGLTVALRSAHDLAFESATTSHTLLEGFFHGNFDIFIPIGFGGIDKNEVADITSHLADLVHEVGVVVATESNGHPSAGHGLASFLLSSHIFLKLLEGAGIDSSLKGRTAHEATIREQNGSQGRDVRQSVAEMSDSLKDRLLVISSTLDDFFVDEGFEGSLVAIPLEFLHLVIVGNSVEMFERSLSRFSEDLADHLGSSA